MRPDAEHKANAPRSIRCFVLTVSDSRTEQTDTGGRAIAELLASAGHQVAGRAIVKDDPLQIREVLQRQLAARDAQVIVTTGGTGITSRDSTFEVVHGLLEKELTGFGELFRMLSYEQIGPSAMMSRATAGLVLGCVIAALPGSEAAVRLATEWLPLTDAGGRVAAGEVAATVFVPPFSRSAMDGYAVVAADTTGASKDRPVRLTVLERIYTGQTPVAAVTRGACSEIATGAPMPDGADAVVMVEETSRAGEQTVDVLVPAAAGQNIGRRGADISPGDVVVRRGDLLNPSRIGALAAVGTTEVEVFARPRVAVLSTGNEVVPPGAALTTSQIYDVNRYTLAAVVQAHGGAPEPHDAAPDTIEDLEEALDACADADIIVFSGGSSVGERDLILDLVNRRGEMIFHGIAVKPGKPTALARIGSAAFFGMPGNPTSCLSNAYILLVPFLRATARLPIYAPHVVRLPLGQRIVSQAGRHQFYTVRIAEDRVLPAFKGSGDITSLSKADGYIEIPADQSTVDEGTIVTVTLF
jgi:molybdopterin molybdotransferase